MTLVGSNTKHIHGLLKSSPEDFVVEEIPLYEPCGEGEHLYLQVKKENLSHDFLIAKVAKHFGMKKRDIGCAGRKDLKATTTQWLSLYLPGTKIEVPPSIDGIEVSTSDYHTNKLRLGHLQGNRFTIRLREFDLANAPLLEERLLNMAENGMPNAFGGQRFGNNSDNHKHGAYIVTKQWDALIHSLVHGTARHNVFALQGDYQRALENWPFGQPMQHNVLRALAKGKTSEQACKTISRAMQKLYVNAFQSYVFNTVLQRRIDNGTWNALVLGDLVWKHTGGGRTFEIQMDELHSTEILDRVKDIDISPTGPLWGSKMRLPSREVLELEEDALHTLGVQKHHLDQSHTFAKGARRPLRVPVQNTNVCFEKDSAVLEFDLPAGSYATVAVHVLLTGEV